MRAFLKKNILEIFSTIYEAHQDIKGFINDKRLDNARAILIDCQDTIEQICAVIEDSEENAVITIDFISEYYDVVYDVAMNLSAKSDGEKEKNCLDNALLKVENSVKNDIKVKYEIVFMPYKASMWDSLESIWLAVKNDSDCDAYVVAVPYYDRSSNDLETSFHYEGNDFPDYVPITNYQAYNLEKRRPDVIYIHNPYDEHNYVTSIDPNFYSKELKKYTDFLVYVPYFVAGYYANKKSALMNIPMCINNIDLFVLQSEGQKKALEINESLNEKMVVLGSPKIDRIINNFYDVEIPVELINRINGRKVIVVNSSISRILNDDNWTSKMYQLIEVFKNRPELFMIWRPHPLLLSTINAMRPEKKEEMKKIINSIDKMSNAFIDNFPSFDISVSVSDGLISDYSSLVLQYTATGKPVLLTMGYSSYRNKKLVCCDYFSNYFIKDGTSVEEFCSIICEDNDKKKDERMNYFKNSLVNADGSCGLKIHKYVKERIEK